jgi:hypothetical protein
VHNKVTVQTTHFSDWALFECLQLEPGQASIGTGESVQLKAVQYAESDLFSLPGGATLPIGEGQPADGKAIQGWQLSGGGKLTTNGNAATYTAPAKEPKPNPVSVTVTLSIKGHKVILISRITVMEDGISFQIDNNPPVFFDKDHAEYNVFGDEIHASDPLLGNVLLDFNTNKKGVWPWKFASWEANGIYPMTQFIYDIPKSNKTYLSTYFLGDAMEEVDSPGFITLDNVPKNPGEYLTGTFSIDKSAETDGDSQLAIHKITGHFRLKLQ